MRYLLDTHALIWWWLSDPQLSEAARTVIAADDLQVFVSPVSAFEIGLKVSRGQLPTMHEPLGLFDEAVRGDGMSHLPLRFDHSRHAALMPGKHRDPFDRMLAAQAQLEGMTVITRDRAFAAFGCKVLW